VRYRRSAIGFLWTMLHPLAMMLVMSFVFSSLFRFEVPNFAVYALSGIVFWNFFSQAVVASMNSLRGNAGLLTKLPVPKAVFPLATVLAGLVNLVCALVPLIALMVATGHPVSPSLAVLPAAILVAGCFTLGAGLLLSPLATFFTDTVELVSILLMLLFYLTPVFYPESIVPGHLRWVLDANPVRWILNVFRLPIYAGVWPDLGTLGLAALLGLGLLAAGAAAFRATSHRIALYL
jgi:ABC-2 type transport system permease protein